MPETLIQQLKYPTPQFTHKDFFELFVGDNCKACEGMVEEAERFAIENNMRFKIYSNSKEVPNIPCIRYTYFYLIGSKIFSKFKFIVDAKRNNFL